MKYQNLFFIFVFLGWSSMVLAARGLGRNVYLAERLTGTTQIDYEGPYCVSWVDAGMKDFSVHYGGLGDWRGNGAGASYSCKIRFQVSPFSFNGNVVEVYDKGSRTISYSGTPRGVHITSSGMPVPNIGEKAKNRFGFFGLPGPKGDKGRALEAVLFGPVNSVLHGIYSALSLVADLIEGDEVLNKLALIPEFKDSFNAMANSCEVIFKEVQASACDQSVIDRMDQQKEIIDSIDYKKLIPKKPGWF